MGTAGIRILLMGMLITVAWAQSPVERFFADADRFFGRYVIQGRVDYAGIQTDSLRLSRLIAMIGDIAPDHLGEDSLRKAFWINAYNLLVIHSVVSHHPLNSPRDVPGFFNRRRHRVAGEWLTLDELEHKRLRKRYKDPRLHFALVCAAMGCPRIIPRAYLPATLSRQLEERTRRTVNDPAYVRTDPAGHRVWVSEIFRWYADDFGGDAPAVIRFINGYRTDPIPEGYSLAYIPYDWTLNGYREAPPPSSEAPEGEPQPTRSGIPRGERSSISPEANLQAYTPSTLLQPGEVEIKLFNNLYTQTAFFDARGHRVAGDRRTSFFTGIAALRVGMDSRWNVGVEVYFKAVRYDARNSSPFEVLKFSPGNQTRSAITAIAPTVMFAPLASFPRLSVQTLLLFPAASDLEGMEGRNGFLDQGELQWWTRILYDVPVSRRLWLYLESGALWRTGAGEEELLTPAKAIASYFVSRRWTLYAPVEFWPTWGDGGLPAYFGQIGGGIKYELSSHLELEALLTAFALGKNSGAGQTYNLGLRWIK